MASKAKKKASARAAYIGVAGWSIPSGYRAALPGEGSHLERYARRFDAVEINSSFRRHHRAETYARWSSTVPSHFRFSVKAPRAFTHEGELTARKDVLHRFVEEVSGLGAKLRVVLVQLPPKLEFDAAVARRFFKAVQKSIDVQLVCEPRHPSWGSEKADRLLVSHSVARVAADPPPWSGAFEAGGYRKMAYFRWHGQPRKYYSDYGSDCLATLERQLTDCGASEVWAIFDNTASGCALGNALTFSKLMEDSSPRGGRRRS